MLQISIENLVTQIVKSEFNRRQASNDEGLYINFDLMLAYYEYNGTFSSRRSLHLLYHKHSGSSYISAFSGILSNGPFPKMSEVEWKHETTHDSCWASISVFSEVYFMMAEEVNSQLEKAGLEKVAPIKLSQHTSFPIFQNYLFVWVPVVVSIDPNDERHYRRILKTF